MIAKLIGLAAARNSKKRWDPTEEPEILRILKKHANIYTFSTYPWTLWIIGILTVLIALYLLYVIYFLMEKEERKYMLISITLLLLYSSCFIFYAGKIEYLIIDKKKGIIKHQLINIFLSKVEKTYSIDDLIDIEILLKGVVRQDGDYTRYFIRFSFKDGDMLIFGECMTLRKASDKFRKCCAILKEIIIPDLIDKSMITDVSVDETTPLNKMGWGE